jgi:hypothetical protein
LNRVSTALPATFRTGYDTNVELPERHQFNRMRPIACCLVPHPYLGEFSKGRKGPGECLIIWGVND